MRRVMRSVVLGGVLVLAAASSASAQRPFLFLGGGASIPVGDFADFAKTGWIIQGGFGVPVGPSGLSVGGTAFYGSNKHDFPAGTEDKTKIMAGLADLSYNFSPAARVSPYVLGGVGILTRDFEPAVGASESETKFAYSGALGLTIRVGARAGLWLEGRFLGSGDTKLLPLNGGFYIEL
ncbi:MAG: outer membrane protein [Gemmatimonadales bacterium]